MEVWSIEGGDEPVPMTLQVQELSMVELLLWKPSRQPGDKVNYYCLPKVLQSLSNNKPK